MPLHELKKFAVLAALIGAGIAYYQSRPFDLEWYWWLLAWGAFPVLIAIAIFLPVFISRYRERKK